MADEESVAALLENFEDESATLGMQGWTFERELLTTLCDLVAQMHATLIQVNSEDGDRPSIDALPRPKTALDRLTARRAREQHEQRVRLLIGPQQE